MGEPVRIERDGAVLTLTLDRPEKKNALTVAMYKTLADALDTANDDAGLRAALIQAEGDVFCSGNDLQDFVAAGAMLEGGEDPYNPFVVALARFQKPLVAAVEGRAVGVGLTMLLHCDLVYVAEDALLSAPFVNLAVVPEAASSVLLPARIGHARAFEIFALGRAVDGRTAAAWGIANDAPPRDEVRAKARAAAEALAARAPESLRKTKALVRDSARLLAQIEAENADFIAQLRSAEAREAFMAFLEKRPAKYG